RRRWWTRCGAGGSPGRPSTSSSTSRGSRPAWWGFRTSSSPPTWAARPRGRAPASRTSWSTTWWPWSRGAGRPTSTTPRSTGADGVLEFWVIQTFNGVSYGALLFLLAGGLSLIFGMMRIVNMTHGSYYLLGGYVGLTVIWRGGHFALAILAGALAIAVVGMG